MNEDQTCNGDENEQRDEKIVIALDECWIKSEAVDDPC
jgi:hypothetical protein